ncbi:MAG: imelysin family protein [Bacteroidetes bacterium]|nr:imelysin family protein [Bacteroidota bacterium]
MLTRLADNLIIPGYTTLMARIEVCSTECEELLADPTPTAVLAARYQWVQLHYAWSLVQMYDFGPAESATGNLGVSIGTFPVNASKMESKISSADTSTANYDRDSRGIYGVEYLLFGTTGDSTDVATGFRQQPNRGAYLRAIIRDIKQRVGQVHAAWTGPYRGSFIANNGTAIGSSTSLVFNEFNKSYENIKNFKWGIPLGMSPGQSGPEPTKVECYYASLSTEYENQSIAATKIHFGGVVRTWECFRTYLDAVPGGADLKTRTEDQIDSVKRALDAFPMQPSLATQIVSAPTPASKVYTELQKLTRFFKSEMSSRLGIAITYSSGDGD